VLFEYKRGSKWLLVIILSFKSKKLQIMNTHNTTQNFALPSNSQSSLATSKKRTAQEAGLEDYPSSQDLGARARMVRAIA